MCVGTRVPTHTLILRFQGGVRTTELNKAHIPWNMGLPETEAAYKIIAELLSWNPTPYCGMKRKVPRTPQ